MRKSLIGRHGLLVAADLHVNIGPRRICKAIFQREGNTLHYSGSYKSRPTNFELAGGHVIHWKRAASP